MCQYGNVISECTFISGIIVTFLTEIVYTFMKYFDMKFQTRMDAVYLGTLFTLRVRTFGVFSIVLLEVRINDESGKVKRSLYISNPIYLS